MTEFPFSLRCSVAGLLRGDTPGAARQPLTFFVSPKKVSKERRPQSRCPFGVPGKVGGRTGNETNSPLLRKGSDRFRFFSVLPPTFPAASTAGKTKAKPPGIGAFGLGHSKLRRYFNYFCVLGANAIAHWFFAVPALGALASGTRRAAALRSPSFAHFSWRDKKSERLPGYLQYAHGLASPCRSAGGRHAVRIPGYAPRHVTTERFHNRTPESER